MIEYGESLPERDFGLRMRFTRGDLGAYYGPTAAGAGLLAQRRRWLAEDAGRYAAALPEAEGMLEAAAELARGCGAVSGTVEGALPGGGLEACRWLGERWEPDFLLMRPDGAGVLRLVGGCVCFPSHWDLGEKLGRTMPEIHAPVPGLNAELGGQIDGFLRRMKPGVSWERANWGLARSGELNLHPSRGLPRLDAGVGADEVWWRLEEQSLVALPGGEGWVLFGIRLVVKPLAELCADDAARRGLRRALETMPEAMAAYKGLGEARGRLVDLLG